MRNLIGLYLESISMNRLKPKPIILVTASALALLLLSLVFSRIVVPKNNQSEFGQVDASAYGILGEPERSIDVLFVGDSEVYASLSPLQIWKEQGIASYDVSTSGQLLCQSKTLLSRALEKQSPRVVVFETNMLFRRVGFEQALWRELANVLPVLEYHNRWKTLTAADFTASPKTTWTHPQKGYHANDRTEPSTIQVDMKATTERESIALLNQWYLEKLISLCRERGIKVVLLSTPSTKNWNARRHNAVQAFLQEHSYGPNVVHLDLNLKQSEVPIDWEQDTRDGGDHLNNKGAYKVSHYMGAWLKDTYGLPDHRDDNAYRSWTQTAQAL